MRSGPCNLGDGQRETWDARATMSSTDEPRRDVGADPSQKTSPNPNESEPPCSLAQKPRTRWATLEAHSTRAIAVTGVFSTLFTLALFVVAMCSLRQNSLTMKASLRAWLAPTSVSFRKPFTGNVVDVEIKSQNTGKQPAQHVFENTIIEPVEPPNAVTGLIPDATSAHLQGLCQTAAPERGGATMYPSSAPYGGDWVSKTLSDEEARSVTDGSRVLMVAGCLGYTTFGEPHHSGFCFLAVPPGNESGAKWSWANCPAGNDAN